MGQSAAYGTLPVTGPMNSMDSFGSNLSGTHPFSLVLPMKDASNLVASLVSQGKTADPTGAVKLINGNIECTSCHNPHVQGIDRIAQKFLVRDSSERADVPRLSRSQPRSFKDSRTRLRAGQTAFIKPRPISRQPMRMLVHTAPSH